MKRDEKLDFAILIFVVGMLVAILLQPKAIAFSLDFIGWCMVLLGMGMMCGKYLSYVWKEYKQDFNSEA
jgi:hypothetical protein